MTSIILFLFFKDFIYLFDRERERERETARSQAGGGAEAEGEADYLLSREPDAGLHPKTPVS